MAKKLNKKVAYSIILILGIGFIAAALLGFRFLRERNPEYCLNKARQAVKNSDFDNADRYYGKAYAYNDSDQEKIAILFEMSEFHLTNAPDHEPNWRKAIACWNTVLNIDPKHLEARRKLLDYFYQVGDSGGQGVWKLVDEHATKLLEVFQQTDQKPGPLVLTAKTRACLEMARQGSETNREELIEQSLQTLEELKKLTPDDPKIYRYMIEAMLLKGELEETRGIQDARINARKNAQAALQEAAAAIADKGTINAYLMEIELVEAQRDPNAVAPLRAKLEELNKTYPKSDSLLSILSASYELHEKNTDRRQELEQAVEYTEKAQEAAGGQNVRYAVRHALLLRRIGLLYNENELIDRAVNIAQKALEYPESTVVTGPRESTARQNRYELQSFIARCYIEKAIAAIQNKDQQAAGQYHETARKAVDEIVQLTGGSTTMIARQWEGLLDLAKGDDQEAYRVLYKVYQEQKALDKPGDPSVTDSYLCYVLSRVAAAQGALGMQREFLEKAISNRNSIAMERPSAILDYANIMLNLQAGNYAAPVLDTYLRIYGENDEVNLMRIQADIQTGNFEQAQARLAKLNPQDIRVLQTQLILTHFHLNKLLGQQVLGTEPLSPGQKEKIPQLQIQQAQLLAELVNKKPSDINPQIFVSICRTEIAQGRLEQAQKLISSFASVQPDNVGVQILKMELTEPDPVNILPARRQELAENVLQQMNDPLQKALMLGQHYRALGKMEQARESFEKAYSLSPDSVDVASTYFGFLLDQKDVKKAEEIFSKIRDKNPDRYEGNLFAAQLEMTRENYTAALRRLDACDAIRPGSSEAALVKSQIYLLEKNYNAAIENARIALQTDLQNGMAARLLASALYERNRNLSGPASLEQTTELERAVGMAMYLNPGDWQLQSAYTEITQDKDPQRALAVRQALLKSTPNVSNALMLGNMAMRMAQDEIESAKRKGLWDIAGDAYQQAYQIEPDNKMVRATYAEFLRQTQQQKKAEELFANDKDTLWRFYLNDGQYALAAEILEKMLPDRKDDAEIQQGLVNAYKGLGERDKMKSTMDQLSLLTLTAEQEIWLIQQYMDLGHHDLAQKRLGSFQERYPADDRGELLLAWSTMYQGNTEKALELIQKYLEKNSGSAAGWRVKGRIHRLMNQPQQAIDALQRSKSISTTPEIRMELATIYNQTNQIQAAIGELVDGLDDPQIPPQMLQMLESMYNAQGMGSELVKFYQKMMNKYPGSAFWYSRTGTFLLGHKSYNDAVTLLEKAWTLTRNTPQEASSLNVYLKALIEANQMEKALTLATEYINTPIAPVAYCNIATIQGKQNQKDKAIESFSKAIEKSSGSPSMLMGTLSVMTRVMGTEYTENWCNQKLASDSKFIPAHIILQNIEEQRGAFNKALEHVQVCLEQTRHDSPDWLEFSNQKATLLLSAYVKTADSNYLNQAIVQLEEILKLQPNNAEVLNNLAYLMADNNVQIEKAVEYSRRAYQAAPGNPVFLDTHAYALCLNNQYADAERFLRQTLQMYQNNNEQPAWDACKHLGMALEGQKKYQEALSAYEQALEMGKDLPEKEKAALTKMIENMKSVTGTSQ